MQKLLTKEEVMLMLKIKKSTLYFWVSQRTIPYVKVGRLLRFKETAILQWLTSKEVHPHTSKTSQSIGIKRVRSRSLKSDDEVQALVNNAKRDILKK
jgi:excisionase family DNA binding protein